MAMMTAMKRAGWLGVVVAAMVGCEDWTRLEVTPDQTSTTAATQAATTTNVTAAATQAATTATTAAAPTPSGGLGVTGASGGFLWKPASESNGDLVVLIPSQYTGSISTVFIAQPNGTVVEVGSYRGNYNGNRAHYWFSHPGSYYGSGIYVVADLEDGTTVNWYIANGGSRTEY
jgi:hypothetical protein